MKAILDRILSPLRSMLARLTGKKTGEPTIRPVSADPVAVAVQPASALKAVPATREGKPLAGAKVLRAQSVQGAVALKPAANAPTASVSPAGVQVAKTGKVEPAPESATRPKRGSSLSPRWQQFADSMRVDPPASSPPPDAAGSSVSKPPLEAQKIQPIQKVEPIKPEKEKTGNNLGPTKIKPLLGVLLSLLPLVAEAGPMVHHIEAVTPRASGQGSTVDVLLEGAYIREPRALLFYKPGIECVALRALTSLPKPKSTVHGGYIEDQVLATLRIAPDAPPGLYPFKLRTASELSTTATFVVSKFPCIDETELVQGENDETGNAQPVPLNVAIRGRITNSQSPDIDLYKVRVKAGQHISAEIDSVRIADKFYADNEFDLMLRILDASGKELARNDDNALHIQDPILSVLAPSEGEYFIEVKQRLMKTAERTHYLVSIGDHARPLAAYPAGGRAGAPLQTLLLGDPAGPISKTLLLPAKPGDVDDFSDMPSPLTFRASAFDNVLENTQAPFTDVPSLPAALNGVISRNAETDTFRLSVKKGERFRVRVFARSLGSPLDARLTLRAEGADPDAAPEWSADDSTMVERGFPSVARQIQRKEMLDPSTVWEVKQEGAYLLSIADMRALGSPLSVYRVEIEPVPNRVDVFIHARVIDAVECPRLNSIAIPAGDRCAVTLYLADAPGSKYAGELELFAEGLPEGVIMHAPRVLKGQRSVPVVFSANNTVPPQSGLFKVRAKSVDGSPLESDCQQSFAFVNHSGGHAWQSFSVDSFAFAVTDPPPCSIEVIAPKIALSQNGELPLVVKIHRQAGFEEAVEIQADWSPEGVRGEPTVTIPPSQSEGILRIFADAAAPPGRWQTAITASTTGGSYYLGAGRVRTASKPFQLEVTEPFVSLKNRPASVRRNDHTEVIWDVETHKPFPGTAKASLLGLPKGTEVTNAPTFSVNSPQLKFELSASQDALLGQYKELACELVFNINGEEIRQRLGKGILRVDPALKKTP